MEPIGRYPVLGQVYSAIWDQVENEDPKRWGIRGSRGIRTFIDLGIMGSMGLKSLTTSPYPCSSPPVNWSLAWVCPGEGGWVHSPARSH